MLSIPLPRLPAITVAVALAGSIVLAGCGGSSHSGESAASGGFVASGPSSPSPAGPVPGPAEGWTALLHGPSHYGASTAVGPQTSHVAWRRALGAPVVAGPVVSASGTAYVAANNGILHAIDVASGHDKWTFDGGGSYGSDLSTSALILPSGEILWPGPRNRLFALSPAGKLLWTLPQDGSVLTPVIDPHTHQLIVADMTGHVSAYALASPSSKPKRAWSHQLASTSYGNPVVAADGTIYETAGDDLFALSPSGQTRWSVTTPASIEVSPAVAVNGIVVFGSNDRYEYGVDPNGHVRWKEKIGNFTYSSPLTLPGRQVVYGNHSGQMTILDSDTGAVIRRDTGLKQLWTSAAVDAHGDVYFASRAGHIYGFAAGGKRLFDLDAGGHPDSYPALAPDGTLLIGDDTGTLFALKS